MSENQGRGSLARQPLQVGAVPGGDGRGEKAGGSSELWVGVESNAKAISVVLAAARVLLRGGDRES